MKKKILTGIVASAMLFAVACNSVQSSDVRHSRFKTYETERELTANGKPIVDGWYLVITDTKTGVQYLEWTSKGEIAITPLYNADGTLCTAGE